MSVVTCLYAANLENVEKQPGQSRWFPLFLRELVDPKVARGRIRDLAAFTGVSPGHISNITRGLARPSDELVERIAKWFEEHDLGDNAQRLREAWATDNPTVARLEAERTRAEKEASARQAAEARAERLQGILHALLARLTIDDSTKAGRKRTERSLRPLSPDAERELVSSWAAPRRSSTARPGLLARPRPRAPRRRRPCSPVRPARRWLRSRPQRPSWTRRSPRSASGRSPA